MSAQVAVIAYETSLGHGLYWKDKLERNGISTANWPVIWSVATVNALREAIELKIDTDMSSTVVANNCPDISAMVMRSGQNTFSSSSCQRRFRDSVPVLK